MATLVGMGEGDRQGHGQHSVPLVAGLWPGSGLYTLEAQARGMGSRGVGGLAPTHSVSLGRGIDS